MSANAAANWVRANKPSSTALAFGESGDRRTDGTTRYQNKYDRGFIQEVLADMPLSMPNLSVESTRLEDVAEDLLDSLLRLSEESGTAAADTLSASDGTFSASGITYQQVGWAYGDADRAVLIGSGGTLTLGDRLPLSGEFGMVFPINVDAADTAGVIFSQGSGANSLKIEIDSSGHLILRQNATARITISTDIRGGYTFGALRKTGSNFALSINAGSESTATAWTIEDADAVFSRDTADYTLDDVGYKLSAATTDDIARLYAAGTLTAARAQDSVGSAHLTAVGSPQVATVNRDATALGVKFDATDDRFDSASGAVTAIRDDAAWAVKMWAKMDAADGTGYFWHFGASAGNRLIMYRNLTGTMYVFDGSLGNILTSSTPLEDSQWHEYKVTFDGVDTYSLFVDDMDVPDATTTATLTMPTSTTFAVGANISGSVWSGDQIEDIRIYDDEAATNLVHRWTLTDTTIQTADVLYPDQSGNGNVWVGSGTGVTRQVDDASGRPLAIELDGVSGYLTSGAGNLLNGASKYTIEGVVKLNDTGNSILFDERDAGGDGVILQHQSTAGWRLDHNGVNITVGSNQAVDTWVHVLAYWDGSDIYLLVDAVEENTASVATAISTSEVGLLGTRSFSTPTNHFSGDIAHFAVYTDELAEARIIQHAIASSSAGDAMLSGSPTIAGDKIVLNGTNYATVSHQPYLNFGDEMTVIVKARLGEAGVSDSLIGKYAATSNKREWWLYRRNDNTLTFNTSTDGTSTNLRQTRSVETFETGEYVFAVVFNSGTAALYANGESLSLASSTATPTLFDTDAPIELGSRDAGSDLLTGSLGPGVIINAALAAGEVAELTRALTGGLLRYTGLGIALTDK